MNERLNLIVWYRRIESIIKRFMRHKTVKQLIQEKWESLKGNIDQYFLDYTTFALSFFIAYFHLIITLYPGKSVVICGIYLLLLVLLGVTYANLISPFITQRSYQKVGILYGVYLIGAYFITVTLNLNNEDFNWLDFDGFWDLSFLLTLVPMLGLAYYWKSRQHKSRRSRDKISHRVLMIQNFVMIALTGSVFREGFLHNSLLSIGKKIRLNFRFLSHLFWYELAFFLFLMLLTYLGLRAWDALRSNRVSRSMVFTTSFILALVFNYTLQAGITDMGAHYGSFMASGATLFQVVFLASIFMVIYILSNRYLLGTCINFILGTVISVVNAVKFNLRNEPLLLSDFSWITNAGFFKEYINTSIVIWSVLSLLLVGVSLFMANKYHILKGAPFSSLRQRLSYFCVIFGLFFGVSVLFRTNKDGEIVPYIPVVSSVYNLYDINWLGINANARFQSLSFVWLKQYSETVMNAPQGYSRERVDAVYEKYKALADEMNRSRSQNVSDQTVIYILSESFVDPTRIDGLSVSEDPIPNIHRIMGETTSGIMQSSGYGGGTANMEFQSLTGLPMSNYNDTASILYSDVVPNMHQFPSLSDAFSKQNREVIHLANANNYSRTSIYNKLGFQKFIATEGTEFKPEGLEQVSAYFSDKSTYQNILNNLDPNQSQFFSVMTMQNHGTWEYLGQSVIQAQGRGFNQSENSALMNYVNLLRETDNSTEDFLNQLREIDKKVTVVFYGDHLPGLFPKNYFKDNPAEQYHTDYFIWSNYETSKLDYPIVNSSDFGAELLEVTNSRVSPYYALLTEVLKKASVGQSEEVTSENVIAEDLKIIQYDISVGRNYISSHEDFFAFPK